MNGWMGFGFVVRRLIFNAVISKDEDDEGLQSNQRCVIVCNKREQASSRSIDPINQKNAIRCKSEASDRKQALEANQKQAIGSEPSQYYAERPAHAVNRGDDSVEGPRLRVEYDDNDDTMMAVLGK